MRTRTLVTALALGLACATFASDAFAGKKAASEQQEAAELAIETTGLASMDQFFGQVQGLIDRLRTAQDNLRTGNDALTTALGLATGTPIADALADLRTKAEGKVSVVMEGNTPRLKPSDAVPENVQQAIDAVNTMIDADFAAVTTCQAVVSESGPLVQQAPGMVAQVPAEAKNSGLKLTEIPGVTKKVKHNVEVTTTLPKEAQKTLEAAKASVDLVVSTFKG